MPTFMVVSDPDPLQGFDVLAAASEFPNPYDRFQTFYEAVIDSAPALSPQVDEALCTMRDQPYGGCLLVRNLPIPADLPATPTIPFRQTGLGGFGTEAVLVALTSRIACPFSFVEWEAKALVHNKYPIRAHANAQFGSNSVEFLMHTETPFREFSPDYVSLLCLRGDPASQAATRICDLRQVAEQMSSAEIDLLRQPLFAFVTDRPAMLARGLSVTAPLALLTERDEQPIFEFVLDLVGVTEEAQRALDRFNALVLAMAEDVYLEKGDLLIMDNHHIAHGRTSFKPRYDGTDRWLQRLLLTSRLGPGALAATDYLIPDRCLEHYPTAYRQILESLASTSAGLPS